MLSKHVLLILKQKFLQWQRESKCSKRQPESTSSQGSSWNTLLTPLHNICLCVHISTHQNVSLLSWKAYSGTDYNSQNIVSTQKSLLSEFIIKCTSLLRLTVITSQVLFQLLVPTVVQLIKEAFLRCFARHFDGTKVRCLIISHTHIHECTHKNTHNTYRDSPISCF